MAEIPIQRPTNKNQIALKKLTISQPIAVPKPRKITATIERFLRRDIKVKEKERG
jgi:hypothetical protein